MLASNPEAAAKLLSQLPAKLAELEGRDAAVLELVERTVAAIEDLVRGHEAGGVVVAELTVKLDEERTARLALEERVSQLEAARGLAVVVERDSRRPDPNEMLQLAHVELAHEVQELLEENPRAEAIAAATPEPVAPLVDAPASPPAPATPTPAVAPEAPPAADTEETTP